MATRVNHKVFAKPHKGAGLLVKVIDGSHQIALAVPVGEFTGSSMHMSPAPYHRLLSRTEVA